MPSPAQSHSAKLSLWRKFANLGATGFAVAAAVLVLVPLLAIFVYLVIKGIGSVNLAFLTQTPKPVGEPGGGMANAIVGSGLILAIASVIGIPLGIGCGIYLAEYGRNRFGDLVRFTADVLNGVPSIVIGIVAYSLIVIRQKHFSAFSGGVALAIMMMPTVARATEEMLLMVPNVGARGGLGLGIPKWRTTLSIYPAHRFGRSHHRLHAGFCPRRRRNGSAAVHRFGNQFWNLKLNQPTAALPLQIYTYAISPYDDWHKQAWAGALILIVMIVGAVAAVRITTSRGMLKGAS